MIPSGIKVRLPDNHVLIGFNKSGMSVKYGLHVGACVVDKIIQAKSILIYTIQVLKILL